jgi:hypothetical protein
VTGEVGAPVEAIERAAYFGEHLRIVRERTQEEEHLVQTDDGPRSGET